MITADPDDSAESLTSPVSAGALVRPYRHDLLLVVLGSMVIAVCLALITARERSGPLGPGLGPEMLNASPIVLAAAALHLLTSSPVAAPARSGAGRRAVLAASASLIALATAVQALYLMASVSMLSFTPEDWVPPPHTPGSRAVWVLSMALGALGLNLLAVIAAALRRRPGRWGAVLLALLVAAAAVGSLLPLVEGEQAGLARAVGWFLPGLDGLAPPFVGGSRHPVWALVVAPVLLAGLVLSDGRQQR